MALLLYEAAYRFETQFRLKQQTDARPALQWVVYGARTQLVFAPKIAIELGFSSLQPIATCSLQMPQSVRENLGFSEEVSHHPAHTVTCWK
jgi:hypothetical protein